MTAANTPEQQPKGYIITEDELIRYERNCSASLKVQGANIRSRPHPAPDTSSQRIEQVIRELEKIRERNDRKGGEVLNFNDGVAYACDKAIALLQAGDQHE